MSICGTWIAFCTIYFFLQMEGSFFFRRWHERQYVYNRDTAFRATMSSLHTSRWVQNILTYGKLFISEGIIPRKYKNISSSGRWWKYNLPFNFDMLICVLINWRNSPPPNGQSAAFSIYFVFWVVQLQLLTTFLVFNIFSKWNHIWKLHIGKCMIIYVLGIADPQNPWSWIHGFHDPPNPFLFTTFFSRKDVYKNMFSYFNFHYFFMIFSPIELSRR